MGKLEWLQFNYPYLLNTFFKSSDNYQTALNWLIERDSFYTATPLSESSSESSSISEMPETIQAVQSIQHDSNEVFIGYVFLHRVFFQ